MQREQPDRRAVSQRASNDVSRAEACLRSLLAWVGAPPTPRRSTSVAKAVNELLEKEPWAVYAAMRRLALANIPNDLLSERYQLTKREMDVARLLAVGKTNTEVATALAISEHTARRHTEQVLSKLHLHSRAAVAPLFADVAAEASDPQRSPVSVPRRR